MFHIPVLIIGYSADLSTGGAKKEHLSGQMFHLWSKFCAILVLWFIVLSWQSNSTTNDFSPPTPPTPPMRGNVVLPPPSTPISGR
jgi:hypothetical protein